MRSNQTGLVEDMMRKEKVRDENILGKNFPGGKKLPLGYWQRLAISRMLYRDRRIFVMDRSVYIHRFRIEKIQLSIMC
jgi:ABC-type transport system involved in cytochrome bd biosynthesis fused ATPase/permease subunit